MNTKSHHGDTEKGLVMRLTLHERYIFHLSGGYIEGSLVGNNTPEEAYMSLKGLTGQDFGYDARAWKKWFAENDIETAYQGLVRRSGKKRKELTEDDD